jgi:hypothetical protein
MFSLLPSRIGAAVWGLLCLCSLPAVPGAPGDGLHVDILSPRNGSALYFGDETTVIAYRTSVLPSGAQVRLTINGKEALVNPATEINVSVPGLVVGMHEVAATVVGASGTPLVSERVHFEMLQGFSWVARHVAIPDVPSALMCNAASSAPCSFLIDARGDGSSPSTGHFFRVRLVGPAIVMAHVHELKTTPGVYKVQYTAVDPGVYSMSVVLLHASHTGIADPGAGVARQFLNQHIQASPFALRVVAGGDDAAPAPLPEQSAAAPAACRREDEDALTGLGIANRPPGKPWPLCEGIRRRAGAGEERGGTGPPWARGRWVHRDLCRWHEDACQGVGSDRADRLDTPEFADDPWIWVPHGRARRLGISTCNARAHTQTHTRMRTHRA